MCVVNGASHQIWEVLAVIFQLKMVMCFFTVLGQNLTYNKIDIIRKLSSH